MDTNDVSLFWEDPNLIEKGHRIYRSDTPMELSSMPTPIGDISRGETSYVDSDLPVGATFYYRVSAFIDGFEQISNETQVTVRPRSIIHVAVGSTTTVKTMRYDGGLNFKIDTSHDTHANYILPDFSGNLYVALGNVVIRKSRSGVIIWSNSDHSGDVLSISQTADDRVVTVSSNEVCIIDASSGQTISKNTSHSGITSMSVSLIGTYIILGKDTGYLARLDLPSMSTAWEKSIHGQPVVSLQLDNDDNIYSASHDGFYSKSDARHGDIIWSNGHTSRIYYDIDIDDDGNVYAIDATGRVEMSTKSGGILWRNIYHSGRGTSVSVDVNGYIHSSGVDGNVIMISAEGEKIWEYSYGEEVTMVRLSKKPTLAPVADIEIAAYTLDINNTMWTDHHDMTVDMHTLKGIENTIQDDTGFGITVEFSTVKPYQLQGDN